MFKKTDESSSVFRDKQNWAFVGFWYPYVLLWEREEGPWSILFKFRSTSWPACPMIQIKTHHGHWGEHGEGSLMKSGFEESWLRLTPKVKGKELSLHPSSGTQEKSHFKGELSYHGVTLTAGLYFKSSRPEWLSHMTEPCGTAILRSCAFWAWATGMWLLSQWDTIMPS